MGLGNAYGQLQIIQRLWLQLKVAQHCLTGEQAYGNVPGIDPRNILATHILKDARRDGRGHLQQSACDPLWCVQLIPIFQGVVRACPGGSRFF